MRISGIGVTQLNWENEEAVLHQYFPLVHMVVAQLKKKLSDQADEKELISFGMVGLWDAARKFNHEQGVKFETYATQRIRGEILDGLRQTDAASRTLRKKEKMFREAFDKLEQVHLRCPTPKEISEYLGISIQEYEQTQMQLTALRQSSLDTPAENEEGKQSNLHQVQDYYYPQQEEWLEAKERKKQLVRLIDALPDKEKLVLSLVYFENLSLTDAAQVMGLHKSRISQLHSQAMKRLRTVIEKEKIEL